VTQHFNQLHSWQATYRNIALKMEAEDSSQTFVSVYQRTLFRPPKSLTVCFSCLTTYNYSSKYELFMSSSGRPTLGGSGVHFIRQESFFFFCTLSLA